MPLVPSSSLYSPVNNLPRTRSLFAEINIDPNFTPIFTLGRNKGNGYIALRDLYVTYCSEDPSEATFAEEVFGDIFYWEHLKTFKPLAAVLPKWKLVADTKRKSNAFKVIIEDVKDKDSKTSATSAKYLIDEPWLRKPSQKRTSREATEAASATVDEDLKRLQEDGYLD